MLKIYNKKSLAHNSKGMCGLKEAGALENQQLQQYLSQHGYTPSKHIPGLWKHDTTNNFFALGVDCFGVKHLRKSNYDYLTQALKDKHEVELNWEGKKLCGIKLKYNYTKRECRLRVLGCIKKLKKKFKHLTPAKH